MLGEMRAASLALILLAGAPGAVAVADPAAELAAEGAAVPACEATRAHCLGLQLHVSTDDQGPVVAPAWVAAEVAAANRYFEPLGVGFQVIGVVAAPAATAHVETRAQRNALGVGLGGTVVHVFLIRKLEDVDRPGAPVHGVTWHRPSSERKYVIVAADAAERTLAHELGHVFGLPHSTYAISLMNKTPRDQPPADERRFADEEIAAMRPHLASLLHDHVLADITP